MSSPMQHHLTPYADALLAYASRDWVRLDVPGHGGSPLDSPELAALLGPDVLRLDVPPLVDGIDQGQGPTPMLQAAQLAADAWGARKTWLLTNGASKGNLVTCLALRQLGDTVVSQRSMHSSVMDGMVLGGITGHFVNPVVDAARGIAHGVTPGALAAALDAHPEAVAAYVVSPSYFGVVADVRALARVANSRGMALVVDEAWGSHFGFHPDVPARALSLDADIVVSSTHKLGGSLTQSALLHLGHGQFADRLEPLLSRAFRSMQSTSASSLLMASLDVARSALMTHGHARIGRSVAAAERLRAGVRRVGRFVDLSEEFAACEGVAAIDPLRVVIDTRVGGLSGHEARRILFQEHGIHLEMATDSVVVAVIGAGASPDIDRVHAALHRLPALDTGEAAPITLPTPGPAVRSLREAYFAASEVVPVGEAAGRVSADSLAAYPPGIPNLLPGELVTPEVVSFLSQTAASPFGHVRGAVDPAFTMLRVLRTAAADE